jgi:hypothetical protein
MDPVLLEALLAAAITTAPASPEALAWGKGDLSHLLHAGQKKIQRTLTESPHQLQVVLCARGFGKTYWGASLAVSQAVKKPRSKIKIGTEFQTDLEALILPNFDAVLEDCPEEVRPTWKASKSKFVFPNGSEIALIGLDRKPNGLRGQHGVDLIILEEAGFISKLEALYRSVIVPTTTHRPECKIVLISTPPESLDHYFWTFVDRAEASGSLSTFTIDANPMLKREDIARIEVEMGGRESTQFRREYLCERVSEESRMVLPEFKAERHVREGQRDEYFPFYLKSASLDSGVRDLTVQLFAYYDWKRAKVVVEDEMVMGGRDVLTSRIFSRTREIESALDYKKVRRHADNDNLILLQDLNKLSNEAKIESGHADSQVHWVPTRKDSLEASINLVREALTRDQIEFNPRCKHTIGTCKTALWNKQRTDLQRSEVYGHADAIMALVYLLRNIDKHTNPIPRTYGVDQANAIIFKRETVSDNAAALANAFGVKRKPLG